MSYLASAAAVAECRVGGDVPDRTVRLVVVVGAEPPVGERLPAAGAAIEVLAPAVDVNDSRREIAVTLTGESEVVAREPASGRAAS
jgi:hypothetical protein